MLTKFIGRNQQLQDIDRLIKANQGGVFAVKGSAGIGKSTLLTHIAEQYKDKGQVFVDINDLPPLQTTVEFLKFFIERAHDLKHTQAALSKINGTYKTASDLAAPYLEVINEKGQLAADELTEDLNTVKKNIVSGLAAILLKLVSDYWERKQERNKVALGDPEQYFLKALKKDCQQHPLIFIDTYERLQAANELSQQKISSHYSRPHEHLNISKASISLQDWLERFLPFLQQQGALIIIAGRRTGYWQTQSQSLERFSDSEILDVARSSQHADLQLFASEQPDDLLRVLKKLSFDGNPLWLQVVINFISQELDCGKSMSELAAMENLNDYFATPELDTDLDTANIEYASTKLALFKRVMQHNLDIAEQAWKMALPRRLDKTVLTVIFGEQAETMRNAFVKSGLLTSERILNDDQGFRLHNEIRDLLLAYAGYKKYLKSEDSKSLHQKLADSYALRFQQQQQTTFFLEQNQHQLQLEDDDTKLADIDEKALLTNVTKGIVEEKQFIKLKRVYLSQIETEQKDERAWLGLGMSISEEGHPDNALVAFRKLIELNPNHSIGLHYLGDILRDQGKLDEAIDTYRKLLEVQPDDESAWYNLSIALGQQGKFDEAEFSCTRLLKLNPEHENGWYIDVLALNQLGKNVEAELACRELLKLNPKHEMGWYILGISLGQQDKLDEAIDAYREHLKIQPKGESAWYYLGNTLLKQDKFDQAADAYRNLLKIKPEHESAWYFLGIVLHQLGDLDEAVKTYRKHLQICPKDESALSFLGDVLRDKGLLDEAEYVYHKLLKIQPNDESILNSLGVVFVKQSKLEQAQQTFEQILELNPNNLSALCNDAELAVTQQDKPRCQKRIEQALALVDNKKEQYAILPFLAWLVAPASSYQSVLDAIQNLDPAVEFTWEFSTTEPAITRLNPEQQQIARQFVAYFSGEIDDLSGLLKP